MTTLSSRDIGRLPVPAAPSGGWIVVAAQELRDVWLSARGPALVLVFSLLLSLLTYLAATNEELNIIDQKDTVNLVMQLTLGIGVAASLLFSADTVSGERERETLESLLLTPVPRRQIALGKLLAAASAWPVMIVVAVPYVWALKGGAGLLADAVLAGFVVGSLLTAAFGALGLTISIFSNSNRLSLLLSFFLFVALLAPTQLPLSGWFGDLITNVNPVTAGSTFLDNVVVKQRGWGQESTLLIAPIVAALIATSVAFLAAGRLRLQGGMDR
ncbi:MAG TPA: ABC transporter permease subunit [Dehalococcoidia bacterium]|nr:ABC transporter permease subunit [Dehalococcoidia bacterium]